MESVGEEILREILVNLPTRDLARSSCVSRLWRIIVSDPSFRSLHGKAPHIVSRCRGGGGCASETLLVTEISSDSKGLEMIIHNAFLAKPLCRVTDLSTAYGAANACNGFVLFASPMEDDPLYVCNPITGEKLKISPPPVIDSTYDCRYAMGFSPSTHKYKLFRLSLSNGSLMRDSYLDVYTLGAHCNGCGWRRNPYTFPHCMMYNLTPPLLLDGILYVVTQSPDNNNNSSNGSILVIDMASEVHRMYRLPDKFAAEAKAEVHTFELCRRLCIALCTPGRKRLCFWVMPSMQGRRLENDVNGKRLSGWEQRYTFNVNLDMDNDDETSCAWLDHSDGMLCYRLGDCLYKYNTTKKRSKEERRRRQVNGPLDWDYQIKLPKAPSASRDDLHWNAYGGYRPSLVSPSLAFASTSLPEHRDEQELYEHAFQHAIRCKNSSKKRPSSPHCTSVHRATKGTREPTP